MSRGKEQPAGSAVTRLRTSLSSSSHPSRMHVPQDLIPNAMEIKVAVMLNNIMPSEASLKLILVSPTARVHRTLLHELCEHEGFSRHSRLLITINGIEVRDNGGSFEDNGLEEGVVLVIKELFQVREQYMPIASTLLLGEEWSCFCKKGHASPDEAPLIKLRVDKHDGVVEYMTSSCNGEKRGVIDDPGKTRTIHSFKASFNPGRFGSSDEGCNTHWLIIGSDVLLEGGKFVFERLWNAPAMKPRAKTPSLIRSLSV